MYVCEVAGREVALDDRELQLRWRFPCRDILDEEPALAGIAPSTGTDSFTRFTDHHGFGDDRVILREPIKIGEHRPHLFGCGLDLDGVVDGCHVGPCSSTFVFGL